jgi:poly-gamma-glutamate capsule biosynthesis protein CapA/YwtB (metallophosphatase superfamily)
LERGAGDAALVIRRLAPLVLAAVTTLGAGSQVKDPSLFDPRRPLERELQTNVPDGFTFTAVGDLIISRPLSQYAASDPAFASILRVLHRSDVVYGNMESTIFDVRTFKGYPYSFEGDWTNSSLPSVATDLRKMGFDIVSRANNHALDWGIDGMRETSRYLDAAGISWAGVGETRGLARAAGYYETPQARVGLVSFASTYRPTSDALPAEGAAPARPGISALAVTQSVGLPPAEMSKMASIGCGVEGSSCASDAAEKPLTVFGTTFVPSTRFRYEYMVDPEDLSGIESSIRSGKQNGDFLIVSIHSHECSVDCDDPKRPQLAADFLKTVAHDAIDRGADAFVTTGIHNLGPIEIYRGRPIFYGLANFFWSDIQLPLPHDLFQENAALLQRAFTHPGRATPYDLAALLNAEEFANTFTFQSVMAQCTYEHNRLSRITLYAVDLGYGHKLTRSGVPELAPPNEAQQIFTRIAAATRQFGLPALDMHVDGSEATIQAR